MSRMGKRVGWLLAAVVPIGLAAVVAMKNGGGGASQDPARAEKDVRARCAEFWNARLKGDWDRNYEMTEPRIKEEISQSDFKAQRGVIQYLGFTIEKVEINGNQATLTVKVEVKIEHPMVKGLKNPYMETMVKDQWLRIDGTWYRKYEPPGLGQK